MDAKRIPLSRAKQGMVLADSVYTKQVCLVNEGTVLKQRIISLLENYNIKWVTVLNTLNFMI